MAQSREEYLAKKRAYYKAHKEQWDNYRKVHREEINARRRKWRAKNSEACRAYQSKWKQDNLEKSRGYQKKYYDSHKEQVREYYLTHKEQAFENVKRSMKKYPSERKVRALAMRAIENGTLVRGVCEVCGSTKVDAHHDDYNKPLEVRWLCREHHLQWHSKNKPIRVSEDNWLNKEGE